MEVRVCKNCRRLFKYIYGPDLCPECVSLAAQEKVVQSVSNQNLVSDSVQNTVKNKTLTSSVKTIVKEEEAIFEQVRDYIMTHPKATVAQISEANDVSPTKLFEWIRDDRLEFSDDSKYAWFTCEKCGTKIQSGRLCNRCKTR